MPLRFRLIPQATSLHTKLMLALVGIVASHWWRSLRSMC